MNINCFWVFLFVSVILLGVNCVSSGFVVVGRSPRIISVGSDVEDDYASIQEAINSAEPGDTINVKMGVYYENVVVNKSVLLFGEDREGTIIDGGESGHVVFVEASNVTVCNFTLRNSGIGSVNPFSGVRLENSHDNLISSNFIVFNQYGVHFSCSANNTFVNNIVAHSIGPVERYGIRLYGSENNTLTNNYVYDNKYGIYVFGDSDGNVIKYNNVSGNSFGLYFAHSERNLVEGNTVVDSGLYGVVVRLAGGNFIFHNNFVDNSFQLDVSDAFANVWDDGYPSGGNYWSGYVGVDEFCGVGQNMSGSDGLGDTAYGSEVANQDKYPLMGFFRRFDVVWNGSDYSVLTVCGSTITGFSLVCLEAVVEISLNISGVEGTFGFCRVSVPGVFLEDFENGEYVVVVNGNYSLLIREIESSGEYDVLYFTYVHGPFIPEFAQVFLMLLFLFLTFAILLCKLAADMRQV